MEAEGLLGGRTRTAAEGHCGTSLERRPDMVMEAAAIGIEVLVLGLLAETPVSSFSPSSWI